MRVSTTRPCLSTFKHTRLCIILTPQLFCRWVWLRQLQRDEFSKILYSAWAESFRRFFQLITELDTLTDSPHSCHSHLSLGLCTQMHLWQKKLIDFETDTTLNCRGPGVVSPCVSWDYKVRIVVPSPGIAVEVPAYHFKKSVTFLFAESRSSNRDWTVDFEQSAWTTTGNRKFSFGSPRLLTIYSTWISRHSGPLLESCYHSLVSQTSNGHLECLVDSLLRLSQFSFGAVLTKHSTDRDTKRYAPETGMPCLWCIVRNILVICTVIVVACRLPVCIYWHSDSEGRMEQWQWRPARQSALFSHQSD